MYVYVYLLVLKKFYIVVGKLIHKYFICPLTPCRSSSGYIQKTDLCEIISAGRNYTQFFP